MTKSHDLKKIRMATILVKCPSCNKTDVVRHGYDVSGKERFLCRNALCQTKTFQLKYVYEAKYKEISNKIIEMAINSSGIRDTSRVLKISPTTVIEKLKQQENKLIQVNKPYLESLTKRQLEELYPKMVKIEEAEIDEMWSFVGKKEEQCWLWHAIDHRSGKLLAYVFGRRKDEVYKELRKLLKPFGINRLYTDYWGAYTRHPQKNEKHIPGKKNTQRIESKHLTFRTRVKRLARETICFSKKFLMHKIVVGLFINRHEFGCI